MPLTVPVTWWRGLVPGPCRGRTAAGSVRPGRGRPREPESSANTSNVDKPATLSTMDKVAGCPCLRVCCAIERSANGQVLGRLTARGVAQSLVAVVLEDGV